MSLAPYLHSVARIVFGFLLLRHGMERWFAFPEPSAVSALSYQGLVEWAALPAGLLLMLGLFTRPVAAVMAIAYLVLYPVGPLQVGWWTHRNGGDPVLLNAAFFLYLAAAGGGAWSLDRLRTPRETAFDNQWAPRALLVLRVVAGVLFTFHGLEKWFGVGGGRGDINLTTIRGVAGLLECVGGPLLAAGVLTRPVAFVLAGQMAVAYFTAWAPRGFWESFSGPGMEASILNCYVFLLLSAAGPGAWRLGTAVRGVETRDDTDAEGRGEPARGRLS